VDFFLWFVNSDQYRIGFFELGWFCLLRLANQTILRASLALRHKTIGIIIAARRNRPLCDVILITVVAGNIEH